MELCSFVLLLSFQASLFIVMLCVSSKAWQCSPTLEPQPWSQVH